MRSVLVVLPLLAACGSSSSSPGIAEIVAQGSTARLPGELRFGMTVAEATRALPLPGLTGDGDEWSLERSDGALYLHFDRDGHLDRVEADVIAAERERFVSAWGAADHGAWLDPLHHVRATLDNGGPRVEVTLERYLTADEFLAQVAPAADASNLDALAASLSSAFPTERRDLHDGESLEIRLPAQRWSPSGRHTHVTFLRGVASTLLFTLAYGDLASRDQILALMTARYGAPDLLDGGVLRLGTSQVILTDEHDHWSVMVTTAMLKQPRGQ